MTKIIEVKNHIITYKSDNPEFSHLLKETYINTAHSLYFRNNLKEDEN